MRRVAIDFGTTGIRTALMEDERLEFELLDVEPTISGVSEVISRFAGKLGTEVTLRVTKALEREKSAEYWQSLANQLGCRWFRTLGELSDECPAIAVGLQFAMERRLNRLIVVEGGAASTVFAMIAARGQLLAFQMCSYSQLERDCDFESAVSEFQALQTAHNFDPPPSMREPIQVLGIGGNGPKLADVLCKRTVGLEPIIINSAKQLPTIGILCANIVRFFETSLDGAPDNATLSREFLHLMDRAYDAITREGYDLDDAECQRVVWIETSDDGSGGWIDCGMRVDVETLKMDFREDFGGNLPMPPSDALRITKARVIADIEPVKPAVSRLTIGD